MEDINLSFYDWYKQKFGNGIQVASYLFPDISQTADLAGVNWSAVLEKVKWISGKPGKVNANNKRFLSNGNKKSVGVYASISRTDSGIEFPVVTFTKRGDSSGSIVFNGLEYLSDEYERDGHGKIDPERKKQWERKKAERQKAIDKQLETARIKHEEYLKYCADELEKDLKDHDESPQASSFFYTDKKLIARILKYVDARTGKDKYGNYISLALHNIDGKRVGVQKIYERKFKKNGELTNKLFTNGMDKNGAHLVIGNFATASRRIGFEGFATGASAFLAHLDQDENIAAIIGLDAGNLVKVISAYKTKYPDTPIEVGLDNDMWKQKKGKGNKGLLIGLDLLELYPETKAFYPTFEKYDTTSAPTDWNDLHKLAGLKEVYKQLRARNNKLKLTGDLFERKLLRLQYANGDAIQEEVRKATLAGMNVGIEKYKPSDVIELIMQNVQHAKNKVDMKKLREHVGKIFRAKVREAQSFRCFTAKYTDPKKRPDHVTYTKFNKSFVDQDLYDHIMGLSGIVICRIPMGGGKTQFLIKPALHTCENGAVFCHRTSLVGGSYEVFNTGLEKGVNDVVHYQERYAKELLGGGGKLAACINSCLKPEFNPVLNNLDGLFIDEASQTLRHTCAGGAIKYPVAVFNKMLDMVSSTTDHVILTDADANDTLVEFCELALKVRNKRLKEIHGDNFTPEQIHIIDGETNCNDINIYHTDNATAFLKATQDVIDGHRTLIANDSADDGEKLYNYLKEKAPEKKGLLITMETKPSDEVIAFTDSPNRVSKKYDYIIYSPSISSGVSITNGHFKRHYGLFCGTVAPSDAIQMIRRDRKSRSFVLGLVTKHSSRETNPLNMWLSMLLVNDSNLNIELDKERGAILLKTQDLEFDRFRIDLITQENKSKNDFANNMLLMLWADGYQLHFLDADELAKEQGKLAREKASEQIKNQDLIRHLNLDTPSEAEAKILQAKPNLSKDERAKLNRRDIERLLLMPVTEDSIGFLKKGGLRKVALMELLRMKPDEAIKYDQAEIEAGVQPSKRTYASKQQRALRDFFEIAGIDWETGTGCATPETLDKAVKHLTSGDRLHVFNNIYKFGGFIKPGAKITNLNVFKNIGEALGLKAKGRQIGRLESHSTSRIRYVFDGDSWNNMDNIQNRRVTNRISAWKVERLDGSVIHNQADNYISEQKFVDHNNVNENALLTWKEAVKHALNTCNIPLKNAGRVVKRLIKRGAIEKSGEKYESFLTANLIYEQVAETLAEMHTKDFDFST